MESTCKNYDDCDCSEHAGHDDGERHSHCHKCDIEESEERARFQREFLRSAFQPPTQREIREMIEAGRIKGVL